MIVKKALSFPVSALLGEASALLARDQRMRASISAIALLPEGTAAFWQAVHLRSVWLHGPSRDAWDHIPHSRIDGSIRLISSPTTTSSLGPLCSSQWLPLVGKPPKLPAHLFVCVWINLWIKFKIFPTGLRAPYQLLCTDGSLNISQLITEAGLPNTPVDLRLQMILTPHNGRIGSSGSHVWLNWGTKKYFLNKNASYTKNFKVSQKSLICHCHMHIRLRKNMDQMTVQPVYLHISLERQWNGRHKCWQRKQ